MPSIDPAVFREDLRNEPCCMWVPCSSLGACTLGPTFIGTSLANNLTGGSVLEPPYCCLCKECSMPGYISDNHHRRLRRRPTLAIPCRPPPDGPVGRSDFTLRPTGTTIRFTKKNTTIIHPIIVIVIKRTATSTSTLFRKIFLCKKRPTTTTKRR